MRKIWLITGAARGFGRVWTEAALKRGDGVIATAREPEKLADLAAEYGESLLPVKMDVCDRAAVAAAVETGFHAFARIDVVVNWEQIQFSCSGHPLLISSGTASG